MSTVPNYYTPEDLAAAFEKGVQIGQAAAVGKAPGYAEGFLDGAADRIAARGAADSRPELVCVTDRSVRGDSDEAAPSPDPVETGAALVKAAIAALRAFGPLAADDVALILDMWARRAQLTGADIEAITTAVTAEPGGPGPALAEPHLHLVG